MKKKGFIYLTRHTQEVSDIPFPRYPIKANKIVCRVCKSRLLLPTKYTKSGKAKSDYHVHRLLYNRTVCSFECLIKLYDDSDVLTDRLY